MSEAQSPISPLVDTQDPEEINRIDLQLQEAYKIRVSNMSEAIELALDAKVKSEKISYLRGVGQANAHLGLFYMIVGRFDEATAISKQALKYFQHQRDLSGEASALYTLGSINYKTDNFHIGLKYLQECCDIQSDLGDKSGKARTLKAMGTIYEFFSDYENAEKAYRECMKLSRSVGDKMTESNATCPLSGIYLRRKNVELADELADLSIQLKKETGDVRGLGFAVYAKAKVLLAMKKYAEAEPLLLQSAEIHKKQRDSFGEGFAYVKLGKLHLETKNFKQAKVHLRAAISIAEDSERILMLIKSYHLLYRIAKEEGETDEALLYLEKHLQYKQQVINEDTSNIIKSLKLANQIQMLEQEAQLQREKKQEVERKNSELDTLIYRISHDIRGPIVSLLGLHQLIDSEIGDPKAREYFNLYHTQIERLNSIVMDLISLSHVKSHELKLVPIDFDKMIKETLESFRYLPGFESINFEFNIQQGLVFQSDPRILAPIFQNLIENTIKYTTGEAEPKVAIQVSMNYKTKSLRIDILDNGIGIAPEFHGKIFDLFFRATSDPKIGGTGLGLYIVKNAVEKLSGTITLESKLAEGTTFTMNFPGNF